MRTKEEEIILTSERLIKAVEDIKLVFRAEGLQNLSGVTMANLIVLDVNKELLLNLLNKK